jgi:hypothetical protein
VWVEWSESRLSGLKNWGSTNPLPPRKILPSFPPFSFYPSPPPDPSGGKKKIKKRSKTVEKRAKKNWKMQKKNLKERWEM